MEHSIPYSFSQLVKYLSKRKPTLSKGVLEQGNQDSSHEAGSFLPGVLSFEVPEESELLVLNAKAVSPLGSFKLFLFNESIKQIESESKLDLEPDSLSHFVGSISFPEETGTLIAKMNIVEVLPNEIVSSSSNKLHGVIYLENNVSIKANQDTTILLGLMPKDLSLFY